MAFNLQIQQETYSEVISLPLLAGCVNHLTRATPKIPAAESAKNISLTYSPGIQGWAGAAGVAGRREEPCNQELQPS